MPYCFFDVIHQTSRSQGVKNQQFESNLRSLLGRSQLSNPSDLPCFIDFIYMGQVTKVRLSCYLVLIAKPGNKTAAPSWPDPYSIKFKFHLTQMRPRQNGPHFADNIFKYSLLKENLWILNKFHWNIFLVSNWQHGSIGSVNGLAPKCRWQAIVWAEIQHYQKHWSSLDIDRISCGDVFVLPLNECQQPVTY